MRVAGPLLGAGGQKYLDLGVRQDDGADIPAVHEHVVPLRDGALGLGEKVPHLQNER